MDEMPYSVLNKYYQVIKNIQAEEQMMQMAISAYPHTKPAKSREFFNKIKRVLKHGIITRTNKTPKELALEAARKLQNG